MDTQTAVVIVAIFALIALAAFLIYRRRAKVEIQGPGGLGLKLEAEDHQPRTNPGIQMEGVTSRAGGVDAEDRTGRGVGMKDVDAYKDVRAVSGSDPKAGPPA